MEIIGDEKNNILVQGNIYRVCSLVRLTSITKDKMYIKHLSLDEGLAVEQKCKDNSFIVVAILKYDKITDDIILDPVSFRIVDTLKGRSIADIEEFINCVDFAKQALLDIHDTALEE